MLNPFKKSRTAESPNDDYEFKETFLLVNASKLDSILGNETLIVCGSSRGMTSVVSFALYELEYFIGNRLQSKNYEDLDFQEIFPDKQTFTKSLSERKPLLKLVRKRNADYDRWGFKLPRASDFADDFGKVFRNPICVLCVRNPVATARSITARNPNVRGGIGRVMMQSQKALRAIQSLTESSSMPSIIINMDEAQRHPELFLSEFSELLRLDGDLSGIAAQIEKRSYKSSAPRAGITFSGPK
ncbi:hypothetical protein [Salipiger sp.]|uniref:hypothetical protein n=1 Tax=Salipiger sp. TaxID=2078585 RepID=UPI003A97F17B